MLPAEAMFAAAREIAEAVVAERAAHRKALKDASNARRRARRAASPKPKAEVLVVIDDDLNYEPGCRCHVVRMPPCSWCENGGDVDADDETP